MVLMPPDQSIQVIAVEDMGRIVATIFGQTKRFDGRTCDIAGNEVTGHDLERMLSEAAARHIVDQRFPEPLLARTAALFDEGRFAEKSPSEDTSKATAKGIVPKGIIVALSGGSIMRMLMVSFSMVFAFTLVARADDEEGDDELTVQQVLNAPGPEGALAGTLTLPDGGGDMSDETPVVLIVPGSGPTDRNGNSPFGISAAPYALLAEALAERGIPSVRIDKRGMFGSADAIADANDARIAAYGDDLLAWAKTIRERLPTRTGERCVIPLGHSEGGLVALAAIGRLPEARGLILVSTPGRPLGEVMRQQLRDNPANAPLLAEAEAAITTLERGERVATSTLNPALQALFAPEVQGFLIDAFGYDPAALMAKVRVPVLVIQGLRDLQVGEADARRLADAAPDAALLLVPDVNHVLKVVSSDDIARNFASYGDPDLPIALVVVEAVVQFLEQNSR